ncbi:transcriptional regulator [Clostridioides difficile]|nr:transcriptional regulator [Clostridioides difficile]
MIQQLSDAELEIMKIIWTHDKPVLFASLLDELTSIGKTWQKNTLITLLARLMDKGYLKAKKLGRRNEYSPLISESEYQTSQTKKLLDKIYEGNVKGLVSNLIQSDLLTDEEYDELKELLEGEKDK